MNLNFPSTNQLRYAQSVFPSETSGVSRPLPPDVINRILIEADDDTFYDLCTSPEFASFCSANSAYSEAIYEERARKRVAKRYSQDLIQFKPKAVLDSAGRIIRPAMKWREFDQRMNDFIKSMPYVNILAEYGRLMELQIMFALTGQIPDMHGIRQAALHGYLDVLKWIYEKSHMLPDGVGIIWAVQRGHLNTLKWIYEKSQIPPNTFEADKAAENGHLDILKWMHEISQLLPNVYGLNLASRQGHLDVLKWVYEQSGLLPNFAGAKLALRNHHQDVVDWLATKGVFPN